MNKKIDVDEVVLQNLFNESVGLANDLQDFIFKVRKTLKNTEDAIDDTAVILEPILCEILFHDWLFMVGYMNDMANYADDDMREKLALKNYPFNASSDANKCPNHCRKLRDLIAQFYKDLKDTEGF